MPERVTTFGEFILGLEGIAILRAWMTDPERVKARTRQIVEIVEQLEEVPWDEPIIGVEQTVAAGYGEWACIYDAPGNPVIVAEEPVVRDLIARVPVGDSLDAACGTGRHAAYMASLGHRVTGVDATPEMLAVAKSKIPSGQFELGELEAIPLPNGSIDLVVCSLALTHCANLGAAVSELGRVLRTGGRAIVADVHPFAVLLGNHAQYRKSGTEIGFVTNHVHLYSDYLDAFGEAGLRIVNCLEPLYEDKEISAITFSEEIPELMEAAVRGVPVIVVWELVKGP